MEDNITDDSSKEFFTVKTKGGNTFFLVIDRARNLRQIPTVQESPIYNKVSIGNCPVCGKPVCEGKLNFYCSDRDCKFALWKESKYLSGMKKTLTKKMATDLLKKGRTYAKDFYSAKKDKTFAADLVMAIEHLAKTADSLYNTSTGFSALKRETETNITEGGKPYGTDLSPQGGLPVSEPDRTGRADEHWEVRDAAQDLPCIIWTARGNPLTWNSRKDGFFVRETATRK